jgi:hypothetical protein
VCLRCGRSGYELLPRPGGSNSLVGRACALGGGARQEARLIVERNCEIGTVSDGDRQWSKRPWHPPRRRRTARSDRPVVPTRQAGGVAQVRGEKRRRRSRRAPRAQRPTKAGRKPPRREEAAFLAPSPRPLCPASFTLSLVPPLPLSTSNTFYSTCTNLSPNILWTK